MMQAFAHLATAVAALALALASLPAAAADTPAHYAYQQQLTVSGREAVVQYRLPRGVYLHALSAELHDLRVFDADGTRLPFALRAPAGAAQASRQGVAVRIFPVFAQPDQHGIDAGVEIRRAGDGTVISVEARTVGTQATAPALSALVLDMGAESGGGAFDALQFTLPAGTGRYEARLGIETSDDLQQWHGIADSSVSWMVSGDGQALASDRIAFEPRQFRYARIHWLAGKPLQFAGIRAEAVRYKEIPAPLDTLLVQPVPGKAGTDLMYPSAIAIPVQRVGLQFSERNVSLPAELGRYRELPSLREARRTTWQFEPLVSATFYRFGQGGRERLSGDVPITPLHSDHWVLRPLATSGSQPALRLGWSPATLVFLANGRAPYTLAYGRRDAKPAAWAIGQVAPGLSETELGNLERATAAAERFMARPAAPAPGVAAQASASAASRKGILWGTLALGLCVLAAMAWQLVRQMK
ncbi:DUF3999 family protein [Pseudoduganella sp. SL102]|uniref:DUF3999 family protein n=1 Tax=Pseudoduganella sp. SL102 TaxID=2995154 RepID=UPI00248B0E02|nr:DUF3999 family protein [Pseudoduganella sp. SL102]WBS04526.1 DUF3999 family protein [Pseudoduganella sp. SL102]